MLKRSKLLVAFLVVTVLCASVGFAAVTDTFTVTGTVDVNAASGTVFDKYVVFSTETTDTTVVGSTGVTINSNAVSFSDDTIEITVPGTAFTDKGQTITVTAKIKSTYTGGSVTLSGTDTVKLENLDDVASVQASFDKTTIDASNQSTDDDVATLTIVITLNEIPADSIINGKITGTITATAGTAIQG